MLFRSFDGKDLKAWVDVQEVMQSSRGESRELPLAVKVSVDFYPMSILLSKGIILGIESELVQRRDINFSYFKLSTRVRAISPRPAIKLINRL